MSENFSYASQEGKTIVSVSNNSKLKKNYLVIYSIVLVSEI